MTTETWRRAARRWLAFVVCCMAGLCAATAGNIDSTNRHAWSENAGWVNFAPTNGGGATLHFDGTSGWLAGCAWGENIGWVKLGDNTGGPYNNTSSTDWGVNLNASSNLSGYAWGENVGWIKFNPAHSQVAIDEATGRFDGYAWGENIGWIHFSGAAPACPVRTQAFDLHPLGTPDWWLALYGVGETDDEGDGVPAWQEYVADTDPTDEASYFHIAAISNLPPARVFFASSANRVYTLQQRDDLLAGSWTNIPAQVNIQGSGGLTWLQDTGVATGRFYRIKAKVTP